MKLSHKKVFDILCAQFWLQYRRWEGWYEPKNYHIFTKDWQDFLRIEIIPAWKYLKTIYVMPVTDDEKLLDVIENAYVSQRIGQSVDWCIDYQTSKGWKIF